jgi:DNA-directed RNA polymerase subunit F
MVKVQAIIDFNYKNYNKIKDLQPTNKTQEGKIFAEDIFNVEDEEALYLTGKNKNNIIAVKVLEVIPEIKEEKKIIQKAKNKNNKKKGTE